MNARALQTTITNLVSKLYSTEVVVALDQPADSKFGDYTTNIAMVLAKGLGRNPVELAGEMAAALRAAASDTLSDVSVAGPGFINITLTNAARASEIANTSFENFSTDIHGGKKVLVEHSSPNLFKPFHIGHLMNNTIGESVTRLMRASGAQVNTTSFPSDISLGIAKVLRVIMNKGGLGYVSRFQGTQEDLRNFITEAGNFYVQGTKEYEESEDVQSEVKLIANRLYSSEQSDEKEIYEVCKRFNLEYFTYMIESLGSTFDSFIFESEAGIRGSQTVHAFTPAVFTESEGAIVYIPAEERKDINTAVFINSQGNPTYEAKDVGLIDLKFERYHPDISLFVTDAEQIPHFRVVLAAYADIERVRAERGEAIENAVEKSHHIAHGRMSFKGQKMSSRLGGVPTAEDMIAAVREEVIERLRDDQKNNEKLATDIAIGAIKFAILRVRAGQNINFDPDTSLSFEGDSGPYLMYTHARIKSLIEKAGNSENKITADPTIPDDWNATEVEKILIHFSDSVVRAQTEYAPHHIVVYLLQLAQAFNSWYGNTKMIDTDLAAGYRIFICQQVAAVLHKGLDLLGIHAPDRM